MNNLLVKTVVAFVLGLSVSLATAAENEEQAPAAEPPVGYGYGPGMMQGPGYGCRMADRGISKVMVS